MINMMSLSGDLTNVLAKTAALQSMVTIGQYIPRLDFQNMRRLLLYEIIALKIDVQDQQT